jgi:hypothetical protein
MIEIKRDTSPILIYSLPSRISSADFLLLGPFAHNYTIARDISGTIDSCAQGRMLFSAHQVDIMTTFVAGRANHSDTRCGIE